MGFTAEARREALVALTRTFGRLPRRQLVADNPLT